LFVLVILITCLAFFNVYASNYPEETVRIVVVFTAGGSTDALVRIVASELEERLGKRFVVDNRPGAAGEIGWTYTANAEPDGYTLCGLNVPNLLTPYITRDTCQYVLEDFTPLVNIITDPEVLAVPSSSPYKTLEEYVDYAKEHPGDITCGDPGLWGDGYIGMKAIEREAGITLTAIHFEGSADVRGALLGGHIDCAFGNLSEQLPLVEAGQVRILAIMEEKRFPMVPNVPTFKEKGYDIVAFGSSRGMGAPAGIPEEVKNILIDNLTEIVNSTEFIQRMEELGMNVDFIAGDEYRQYLKSIEENIITSFEAE